MSITFNDPVEKDFIQSEEQSFEIPADLTIIDLHYEVVEEQDEFGTLGIAFRAWFYIKGRKYIFTGRFYQRVPRFNGCARIYYKDISQLYGCRTFTGYLGPSAVYLKLCDGVVIAGKLHRRLYRSYRLSGRGRWSCSK
ncbi:hypothetical protein CVT24_002333 [Panaeolus cyanescens]|uniref:Uncharacterized protein n=1 Tax=Panaeolus cyanescens TaxID=181874 RepID=A0A409YIR4_9AGAR|nr:hypothetical protein CVT24_002333 [Panaeolus cyanescens]